MYHRHDNTMQQKDPTALPLRILCALLGLTFGFAGGRIYGPENLLIDEVKTKSGTVRSLPETAGQVESVSQRIQSVLRMDRDAFAGLLADVQKEYERDAGMTGTEDRADLHLRTIYGRWADLDALGALKAALAIKNHALSRKAVLALFGEWAKRDPSGAVQSLATLPHVSTQGEASRVIVRAGAPRDPVAMLALIPKISGNPRPLLMAALGAEWMRLNASHALRRLLAEPVMNPVLVAGQAMAEWLAEDPRGVLSWRRGNQAVAEASPPLVLRPEVLNPARLTSMAAAMAEYLGSPEAGLEWLQKSMAPVGREAIAALAAPADYAKIYLKEWQSGAEKRPLLSSLSGWLERQRHMDVMGSISSRFAAEDPAAALAWSVALPGDEGAAAGKAVAVVWLSDAPVSAPEKLYSVDLSSPAGRAAAGVAVSRLIRSDPAKALEMLPRLKLDPALSQSIQTRALAQLSGADPSRLLEWMAAHPEIKPPGEVVTAALKAMASENPGRALEHVRSHSAPEELPKESAAILSVWLTWDRAGAIVFLSTLPDGPQRDACTAVLTAADVAMTDPYFAANVLPESFEAALRMSDKAERQAALRNVFDRIKQMKVSDRSVLALPGLTAEDRAALN